MVADNRRALTGLRLQLLLLCLVFAGFLLAGYQALQRQLPASEAGRWLLVSVLFVGAQMAVAWAVLPQNRRSGDYGLWRWLGAGNTLTLLRGLLVGMLAGFLLAPQPGGWLAWAPALLYGLERAIDFCDGLVARLTRSETRLGAILDMEFDGLGILVAVALAVQFGKLPAWYLVLGVSRPLFVLGLWLRQRAGKPVYDLPPSDNRRIIAGLQTGFVAVVLWPILAASVTQFASYLFAIPLILSFGRDWLVVSGAIDASSPAYAARRSLAKRVIEGWLPLVARLLGALTVALLSWPPAASAELGLGWLLPAALLLCGVVSRLAALALTVGASVAMTASGLRLETALLMACAVAVLHLGGGRYALWTPEERPLHAKLGAPQSEAA